MKKSFLITLLGILVAGFTFAQSEETRSLSSFSRISAHEGIDVYITEGSKEEARIVSENVDLEDVLTEVSGDRLKIHLDGNNWKNVDVEVYVTYTSLNGISASSAASLTAKNPIDANGSDFDVDVSSAGDIIAEIENADELSVDASSSGDARLKVEANEIEANVSSAGDIDISGTAKYQDIEASSSGDYDGYDLESDEAEASASSGGSVKVNVSSKLDARASSGGSVRYKGSPTYLDASSSSGGSVRKS
ncbi:head GIN domain-containing protein [Ekhidna sp.]|uniref:head GIN domain-containing protein n=1 Tax=Ekhidna sp. TaxID=2608089 RepID=UPI003298F5B9